MAFDWTRDLTHIVTNYHFESYTIGETTVDDLMQVYLLKTSDRTVKGHCLRHGFGSIAGKSGPRNTWAVGLASPKVIYMALRGRETDTANTGKLELNFYRLSDVVEEGGAYSQGATNMTEVVAHDPYLTVEIAQALGHTTTAKPFEVLPWKSDTVLIVDTVNDSRGAWRVHEVSMIDGVVTTHTGLFGTGTGELSAPRNTHVLRNGNLVVNGLLKSWIIDTTEWTQLVESDTGNATVKELSDGTFYWFDHAFAGSKLYDSTLTEVGTLSETSHSTNTSLASLYGSVVLVGQKRTTFGDGNVDEAARIGFSGTTVSVTTFPDYSTGRSNAGWGCIVSDDYWMYYDPRRRQFDLVSLMDGTAHPSIGSFYEVDSDIPTSGNASDIGNWGAIQTSTPAPTGSTYWARINIDGDAITLQWQIQNNDFVESNPVKLVGVSDNDGLPLPLMRASDLEVSSAGATHTFAKLRGVLIPTVDNIIAGANITLLKSGANITINSIGGGGGGGEGNISGAYDIEAGEHTDLGLSDECVGGTSLNSNWTVISGTTGTVNLIGTQSGAIYDRTTRSKGMLVQGTNSGAHQFVLRAPIIGDGEQLVVSLSTPHASQNDRRAAFGIVCTSSTTSVSTDIVSRMYKFTDGAHIYLRTSGTTTIANPTLIPNIGLREYFRCIRTGGYVHYLHSIDGISWSPLMGVAQTNHNYIWLFAQSPTFTRQNTGDPVVCINWIRHCAYTGYDPW